MGRPVREGAGSLDRAGRRPRCDERVDVVSSGGGVGRVIRLPPVRFVRESRRKILQMGSVTDPGVRHEVGGRRRMSLQEESPALDRARPLAVAANKATAERYAANVVPIIRQIQASGVSSFRGVARALTARGVKSARGGAWTARQVINVLERG